MAKLSKKLEEKRAKLAQLIERKAFDAYVRHGVVPDDMQRLAETAADDQKFLDLCAGLSTKALPNGRPTTHYTWRTAGDDRVRHTHSALEGQVFAWTNAPTEGHPGTAPNCRCWAEPYYGNPAIPDTFLQLASERQVSADPSTLWASVETLTRPDASVSASDIRTRTGARVLSTFSGSHIAHDVTLPDGRLVFIERSGSAQSVALRSRRNVIAFSRWTPHGPISGRSRSAFQFSEELFPRPTSPIANPDAQFELDDEILLPNPGMLIAPDGSTGAGAAALFLLYQLLQEVPKAVGSTAQDLPVIAYQATRDDQDNLVIVRLDALEAERARQSCKLYPDVQSWVDQAADMLAPLKLSQTPTQYGTSFHLWIKDYINSLKVDFAPLYNNVLPEISYDDGGLVVHYGKKGSTRLDVLELLPDEEAPNVICDYEVKSGDATMQIGQIRKQGTSLTARYPGAIVMVFQMTPSAQNGRAL